MNSTESIFPVSCIILAGGRGERAGGADKGLITYKNKTLIQHVIDRVDPQVDEIIISANRNLELYRQYSDKVVSDSLGDFQGPLSGIASCLNHCEHEHILIVACDMPSLPNDLVSRLRDGMLNNSISIATINNRHQLALLVKKDLSDSIESQISSKQLKLIQWVESVPFASVSFDDTADAFLNLNTISGNS